MMLTNTWVASVILLQRTRLGYALCVYWVGGFGGREARELQLLFILSLLLFHRCPRVSFYPSHPTHPNHTENTKNTDSQHILPFLLHILRLSPQAIKSVTTRFIFQQCPCEANTLHNAVSFYLILKYPRDVEYFWDTTFFISDSSQKIKSEFYFKCNSSP